MSTNKPWAHLPNAKHIDAVLEDVRARPEAWQDAGEEVQVDALSAASRAACDQAKALDRYDIRLQAAGNIPYSDMTSGRGTAYTLIAWDDSAALLECPPDVLRAMIDLAEPPVCHQAVLLLPYAIVRFGG